MPESRPTRRALTKADGPGAYFGETPHASNDRDLRWGGGRVADDDARVTGVGSVGRRGVEPDDGLMASVRTNSLPDPPIPSPPREPRDP